MLGPALGLVLLHQGGLAETGSGTDQHQARAVRLVDAFEQLRALQVVAASDRRQQLGLEYFCCGLGAWLAFGIIFHETSVL
ncbi:hypothetical protein D3C79_1039270 [compost metagenome]